MSYALSEMKPFSLTSASSRAPADEARRGAAVETDERALIEACRRGERPAMHVLYERYRRRVFALIARIVGAQEAEELTQEVFLRAYRGLEKFRGDAQLSTWMYRLAVNAALSHATRSVARTRRTASEDELLALPAAAAPSTDPRLRERLQGALDKLPAGYRAVLVLHDVEGLQHDEIAQILGCRVGTSKSQLHKARAQMRKFLGEVER
ncbi:MAG TPA: sigma-70 family RNA polymerase sigma factor [Polyangia bacterium]|nr:sigma-70 family RNA polymerase sigma factor [Polyangia bacterium]